MAYKVVKTFKDAQDNLDTYHVGDKYPHKGVEASEERIAELASDKNRRGEPLIVEIKPRKRSKKDAE